MDPGTPASKREKRGRGESQRRKLKWCSIEEEWSGQIDPNRESGRIEEGTSARSNPPLLCTLLPPPPLLLVVYRLKGEAKKKKVEKKRKKEGEMGLDLERRGEGECQHPSASLVIGRKEEERGSVNFFLLVLCAMKYNYVHVYNCTCVYTVAAVYQDPTQHLTNVTSQYFPFLDR